jgi:polyferredoxin
VDKRVSWSRIRKASQIIFFILWLLLFVTAANLAWPAGLVHLLPQLDPLLIIVQSIAGRALVGGAILCLTVLAITLIIGRAWCGWICPVGTVLDFFPFKKEKRKPAAVPDNLRRGKYLILTGLILAAVFGNLTFIILDPITLWERTLTAIWQALNTAFTAVENALSNIPWMISSLTWLDQALRPSVFPTTTVGIRFTWLPVILFAFIILLNLVAERFWCRYLCPLGGLLGFVSRFAWIRRTVKNECKSCGQCSRVCPTGTIDPSRGYSSDPAECTLCMDCLASCPVSQIRFQPGRILPESHEYDPDRRAFLAAGAVTLIGLAVLETDAPLRVQSTYLIRPPGVKNIDLLQKCVRCGLCLRSCPTGALQASLTESGLSGLFTPVVIPRLGYCQFSCNNCGQICPVQAIPDLALPNKQKVVIGHAFIDQNRCIPWADGVTCIVCEEMCPLPEKAITLEEKSITQPDGTIKKIKLPHVLRERCIGCGICEYKCPRGGEAAIRVRRVDIEG